MRRFNKASYLTNPNPTLPAWYDNWSELAGWEDNAAKTSRAELAKWDPTFFLKNWESENCHVFPIQDEGKEY